ncbi:MAG: 16S rRNA (uracil(1498)-N(3))-methyltransferase [Lachnospiraceae bacterium]|nr:16S rRNA (uracil(1498)-N(3))-methyltransferase [Lachnospiraceae bacterium]
MLHIFADPSAMQGDLLTVTGPEVNHIRSVLRMKPGEEISVSSGADTKEYRYGIEEIREDRVLCRLRFVKEADVELPVRVCLFQGLPKADKMEWIVQKTVELGVNEIVPLRCERSVVRLDAERSEKKTARWQTIAEAAAQQSRRQIVPQVKNPMSVKEALAYAGSFDVRIIPYELASNARGTKEIFRGLRPGASLAVFIGPEGGFEASEIEEAKAAGVEPVTLGRRILRTESAAMVVLSWLIYETEIV